MKGKNKVVIILLIVATITLGITALPDTYTHSQREEIDWNLTLVGEEEKILTYDEVVAMPSYEGHGGFFTTVGIKNGPYRCEGVPVKDLCDLVGGISPSETLWVSAPDGYMMVYDYDQVMGDFTTFDPDGLREVSHGELTMILMYEQDGEIISDNDGKPLKIAIVSEDELMTEGSYWVKWVDRIEIR